MLSQNYEHAFELWRENNAFSFVEKCTNLISDKIKGSTTYKALMENIAHCVKNGDLVLDMEITEQEAICFLDYFHKSQVEIQDVFYEYIHDY